MVISSVFTKPTPNDGGLATGRHAVLQSSKPSRDPQSEWLLVLTGVAVVDMVGTL
jgi:hypothetical protein